MVLVLMGLVGSLVIPRVGSIYDGLVVREGLADILHQVEALPVRAYQSGQAFALEAGGETQPAALEMQEGWELALDTTISYRPNGFCTGGKIELRHQTGRAWRYQLTAPFCRPERIDESR